MKFQMECLFCLLVLIHVTSAILGLGHTVQETSPEEAEYLLLNPYAYAETADERRRATEGYYRGRRASGDDLMTASLLKNACPFPKSLRGAWKEDLGGGVILKGVAQHSLLLEQDGQQFSALCYGKSPDERIFLISSVRGGTYYSSCLRLKTDFISHRQFFTKIGSALDDFFTSTNSLPTGNICSA